jgi:flagellar motor protein MotB
MSSKMHSASTHADESDEGYFASFTDLLVGILFIFIIMLMMFATNYQRMHNQTENSAKIFTKINEARDSMLIEMKKSLENEGVPVSIDLKHGILRLRESLLFESGKWVPNEKGKDALKNLANVLLKYVPCLASADQSLKKSCQNMTLKESVIETILIEGHTDNKPFRTEKGFDSNRGLSAMRSITIFDNLAANQPELKNIRNSDDIPILGVSAYADSRPISQTELQLNRRIDIRFIMRSPTPAEIEKINKVLKLS